MIFLSLSAFRDDSSHICSTLAMRVYLGQHEARLTVRLPYEVRASAERAA